MRVMRRIDAATATQSPRGIDSWRLAWRLALGAPGQIDREHTTEAGNVAHTKLAAVHPYAPVGDGKTQANASAIGSALGERLKESVQFPGG
jgi:hypothetical protein